MTEIPPWTKIPPGNFGHSRCLLHRFRFFANVQLLINYKNLFKFYSFTNCLFKNVSQFIVLMTGLYRVKNFEVR